MSNFKEGDSVCLKGSKLKGVICKNPKMPSLREPTLTSGLSQTETKVTIIKVWVNWGGGNIEERNVEDLEMV